VEAPGVTNETRIAVAVIGGKVGAVVSVAAMFLSAACCSDSIVEEGSFLYLVLRALCFPGYLANEVDPSGSWVTFGAFLATGFVAWGALTWSVCFLRDVLNSRSS
jgi:hypothetical protein